MLEQLTTYNLDGSELGNFPTITIHKENLLHRAVHILVFNSSGQLFVRERPATKIVYTGMFTSSVGVHVLPNDTPDATAKENLNNVLGLEVPIIKLGDIWIKDEHENEIVSVYVGRSEKIPDLNLEQSGKRSKFMGIEEITGLGKEKVTPHLLASIRLYQEVKAKNSLK